MNNVVLIGNIASDITFRTISGPNGETAQAWFPLAVDGYKEHTDFIPITVWGKSVDSIQKYLKKGSKVAVKGAIDTFRKADGATTWSVRADQYGGVKFLTPKPAADAGTIEDGEAETGLPF